MHTFVTAFGADKYMHKLEALTVNPDSTTGVGWIDAIATTAAHTKMEAAVEGLVGGSG